MSGCELCPRRCGADRFGESPKPGWCGASHGPRVFRWGPHFGEEPPLVGKGGSGCVFFITEGIAAKKLGDRISVRAEISAVSGGKTYSIESGEMRYSAVEYVGSLYGNPSNDPKLDKMMAAMLREIAPILQDRTDRFVLISMAAGLTIETVRPSNTLTQLLQVPKSIPITLLMSLKI